MNVTKFIIMKKLSLLFAFWAICAASFAQFNPTNEINVAIGQPGFYGSDITKGGQFTINFNKASAAALSKTKVADGIILVSAPKSAFATTPTANVTENSSMMINGSSWVFDANSPYDGGSVWIFSFVLDSKGGTMDLGGLNNTSWKYGFSFAVTPAVTEAQKFNFILRTRSNPGVIDGSEISSFLSPDQVNDMLTSAPVSILPVSLSGLNVSKNGQNALLSWSGTNEVNLSHYRIERSDASKGPWANVGQTSPQATATSTFTYSFTDMNPAGAYASAKNIYYRVVAVDNDGKEKMSQTKWVSFSTNGKAVAVYPNPAKEGFYVTVPVLNPSDKKIILNLMNVAGQIMSARQISASEANNYYFDIKTPGVIAGDYMLQVIMDGEILDTKKIIVQR